VGYWRQKELINLKTIDMSIVLKSSKSAAVHHWMMKEYGSWEDNNKNQDHPCAILQRFGGKLTLTEKQANDLIESGKYNSTAWYDDEIEGGAKTKQIIHNWVLKIQKALNSK
jgi:hypothetical protein